MGDSDCNNIVVCTNSRYAEYIPPLFNSISFHTPKNIVFYVVYSSITENQKLRIKNNISINPGNTVEFIEFDTENELKKLEKDRKFEPFAGSFDAYTRLFLTEILSTSSGTLKEFSISTLISLQTNHWSRSLKNLRP